MLSTDLNSRVNTLPGSGCDNGTALFPLSIHVTLDVFLHSFLKPYDSNKALSGLLKNLYLHLSPIGCGSLHIYKYFNELKYLINKL